MCYDLCYDLGCCCCSAVEWVRSTACIVSGSRGECASPICSSSFILAMRPSSKLKVSLVKVGANCNSRCRWFSSVCHTLSLSMMWHCFFASYWECISSYARDIAVPRCFLKPYCWGLMMACSSRCWASLVFIIFSTILPGISKRDIGLWFSVLVRVFFSLLGLG